jgi:nucleotide-binding universal stress UspA family protein
MAHTNRLVVGVGETDSTVSVLDWAAREAQLRKSELHLVRAYHLAANVRPWDTAVDVVGHIREAARTELQTAKDYLAQQWPDVRVTGDLVHGIAWAVLLDQSEQSALTVLGSRHLGPWGATVLGSVSTVVAARASGPVVVVEGSAGLPGEEAAVVAGVDGSDLTDDVLSFAFDYADRHGRGLHAVFCWRPDVAAAMQWRPEPPAPERADRWLAEELAGWREKYPDVAVHPAVVRDHPVAGLVAAAAAQDLLVVGARARHARLAPLLGSVSQGVLHHATCPVAVVHHR